MLNKPPPISFNLPKEAAFANRNVQEADPMSQPPDVALKQLEEEARMIKEEVAALKWLAKRKEQEWNSILGLLKKKEETWLKVKRQAELTMNDTGFQKIKALAGVNSTNDPTPTQVHKAITSTITINTPSSTPVNVVGQATAVVDQQRKVLIPVSQPLTPQTIQALTSQGLIKSSGMTPDGKRIIGNASSLHLTVIFKILFELKLIFPYSGKEIRTAVCRWTNSSQWCTYSSGWNRRTDQDIAQKSCSFSKFIKCKGNTNHGQ